MAQPECVVDGRNWLGEAPCWDAATGSIYWTDVPARQLHRWQPDGGARRHWTLSAFVTAISTRQAGGLIIGRTHDVALFDPVSGQAVPFVTPERHRPLNRSNDGKCDRQGRFWLGTMYNNLQEDGGPLEIEGSTGSLYRITADGIVHAMERDIGIANTLAWNAAEDTFYFGDTFKGIYAYDYEPTTGTIENRREFAMQDRPELSARGHPDGSTIDAEGFVWNCRWDGGCVIRFAPDGSVDRIVDLPCSRVTSATFGGADLDTLYMTTARYGLTEADLAEQPLAGGLFAYTPGVRGLPDGAFAG